MTTPQRPILVLLPVYNGAAYLSEQLNSILAQTHPSVHLLCRDDGSNDGSAECLHRFAQQWPDRIEVIRDTLGNLGAKGSFAHLMDLALQHPLMQAGQQAGTAPYVALSDQDDIWLPEKLATCARQLDTLDSSDPNRPALVHSDLALVSHDGSPIAASLARYQGLKTERSSLTAQLLSNTLTGCTCLMNRALVQASLPMPTQAIMHDWWISLIASAWGQRAYVDEALMLYRQHGGNAIGAKPLQGLPLKRWRILRLFDNRHAAIFSLNARQAGAFLRCHRHRLSRQQQALVWLTRALAIPVPPFQRILYRWLHKH